MPHFLLLHNIWYVLQKYPLWYQSMSSTTSSYIRQSIKHHPHHKSILFRERRVDLTMSLLTVYLAGYVLIICTPDMHGGNIYRCRNLPVFNDLSEMLPMLSAFGYNVVAPWASWKKSARKRWKVQEIREIFLPCRYVICMPVYFYALGMLGVVHWVHSAHFTERGIWFTHLTYVKCMRTSGINHKDSCFYWEEFYLGSMPLMLEAREDYFMGLTKK